MTAYASLFTTKIKNEVYYQIYSEKPSENINDWKGPYRDKTDAENAAHEEAQLRNLELTWKEE